MAVSIGISGEHEIRETSKSVYTTLDFSFGTGKTGVCVISTWTNTAVKRLHSSIFPRNQSKASKQLLSVIAANTHYSLNYWTYRSHVLSQWSMNSVIPHCA